MKALALLLTVVGCVVLVGAGWFTVSGGELPEWMRPVGLMLGVLCLAAAGRLRRNAP